MTAQVSKKRRYESDDIAPKKRRKLNNVERQWVDLVVEKRSGKKNSVKQCREPNTSFSIMTFNVDENWQRAKYLIFEANADIVCLQELTDFEEVEKAFSERGYFGNSVRRVAEDLRTATFWKSERFVHSKTSQIQCLQYSHSDDTSLVTSLVDLKRRPAGLSASFGAHLVIANVHCAKSYEKAKAKLLQMEKTFEVVSQHKRGDARTVVIGDFNFVPKSVLSAFVKGGRISIKNIDWLDASGQRDVQCPAEAEYVESPVENVQDVLAATGRYVKEKHLLKRHFCAPLLPIYNHADITRKAFITSYSPTLRFKADYIFINHEELLPAARLELPTQMQIAEAGGFGSDAFPSDHIMLHARIDYRVDKTDVEVLVRSETQEELGDVVHFGSDPSEEEPSSSELSDAESEASDGDYVCRDYMKKIQQFIREDRTSGVNRICKKTIEREKLSGKDRDRVDRAVRCVKDLVRKLNRRMRMMQHQVKRFGSQEMTLATKKSDVDIVLVPLYNKHVEPKRMLRQFATIVDELGQEEGKDMEVVDEIYHARVPIVVLDFEGLKCDISIRRDRTAEQAIRYVKKTLKLHPLIRPFLLLIKEFAKRTDICDAFEGTMNSYCWVNIGIWFLRNQFGKDISISSKFDLGDLFIAFFHTFQRVELTKLSFRSLDGRTPPKPRGLHGAIVVLDPFSRNPRNLAGSCRWIGLKRIQKEVRKMVRKFKRPEQFRKGSSFAHLIS